jgi:pimeloyl-ACP methyl ester carboxylesterase
VLGDPGNYRRAVSLTRAQFHHAFGNALSEEESNDLYARWTIAAPARPLFEGAFANFNPRSPAKVDITNPNRGPLLLIGGGQDATVPESVTRSEYKLYSKAPTVNEYRVFADRGHSLTIDHGWKEVADASIAWLAGHGLGATQATAIH